MTIRREQITGLVLAGGRGSRMGGVDKGLQLLAGRTLIEHTLERLVPQVAQVIVNANRNLERYRAFGWPVVSDTVEDFAGPLAGWLVGLQHCQTDWLMSVPCDTPNFPTDLALRLAAAVSSEQATIAMACTNEDGRTQRQPVFCLMRHSMLHSLAAYVDRGERKIDRWAMQEGCVEVPFADAAAFFNLNTVDELRRLDHPTAR